MADLTFFAPGITLTMAISVVITNPKNGSTVSGLVRLAVRRSGPIKSVSWSVDGTAVNDIWDSTTVGDGPHTITASAKGTGNLSTTYHVNVNVLNDIVATDTTPPVVAITSPAANATVSGTVTIVAAASDNNSVATLQFYVNGVALGSPFTAPPYQQAWVTTPGSYTISATATDPSGNAAAASVHVTAIADATAPTIAFTNPTDGASVNTGQVTLAVTAADNILLSSVQFYADGVALGSAHTSAPYQQAWTATVGTHGLSATATDWAGNTTTALITVSVQQVIIVDPPPPPDPSPTDGLLQPSDFILLGHYDVLTNGSNTSYAQGLACRYVSGDLRLMIMQAGNVLHEISLAGKSYGDTISTPTRQWSGFTGLADFKGLYWDETRQVLWASTSYDYVADPPAPTQIYTYVLNDNQTIGTQTGPISLTGVPAKRSYGGVQPLPEWFQSAYSVGPYAVGWGGYTSLMTAGGSASMGGTFYAFDPDNLSNVKVIMDHTPSFNACVATPGADRGRRLSRPMNFFDGGGANLPPGRPAVLPNGAGCWLSPQADSFGRFLWGDSYYQTGCWIETETKHGFITILSGGIGNCWYQGSTLNFDGRVAELHIFDPAMLGEVALGTRSPCDTQPASTAVLPLAGLNQIVIGNTTVGNAAAATFDPSGQRLYVAGFQVGGSATRIYVFSVDSGDTPGVILDVIAPFAGATVQGFVTVLAAHQGDLGGGVALWWRNAANTQSGGIGPEMTGPPYQQVWDTTQLPNGVYYLHASSHATGTTAEVAVTISNSGIAPEPGTVTITSPTDNSTVSGTILIHADTTGDLGGGLIFWWKSLDGTIQLTPGGEFRTGPYEILFNTAQVPNGVYKLHAVTHATGDTPSLTITVAN